MKRLFVVLMMSLIVNVVNAQYCKICHDEDAVISWKTAKYLEYRFTRYTKNNTTYDSNGRISIKLSQCKHNKYSSICVKAVEYTSDPEWDGVKTLVKQEASFYRHEDKSLYVTFKKEKSSALFSIDGYTFYISRDKYPKAFEDIDDLIIKAVDLGLVK